MVPTIPESHPLHRMFRGLAETTFMAELGIGAVNDLLALMRTRALLAKLERRRRVANDR